MHIIKLDLKNFWFTIIQLTLSETVHDEPFNSKTFLLPLSIHFFNDLVARCVFKVFENLTFRAKPAKIIFFSQPNYSTVLIKVE